MFLFSLRDEDAAVQGNWFNLAALDPDGKVSDLYA